MQVSLSTVVQTHSTALQTPARDPAQARRDNTGDTDNGQDDKVGQQHIAEGSTISLLG